MQMKPAGRRLITSIKKYWLYSLRSMLDRIRVNEMRCRRCQCKISLAGLHRLDGLCQDCHDLLKYSEIIPSYHQKRGISNQQAVLIVHRDYQGSTEGEEERGGI